MKLFALFLIVCFFSGIMMRNKTPAQRTRLLLAVGLFMSFAYLFLQQI